MTGNANAVYEALSRRFGERVTRDPVRLEACAWDFGGLVRRAPGLLFRPRDGSEVLVALEAARDAGLPIATRGSGHGQSGQCLTDGGLVLDMRDLSRVALKRDPRRIDAGGGATWRAVIDACFAQGCLPTGPTLVVDTTVAGTLSVAGVGSESYAMGAQVNNVLSLDVATFDGHIVRCSADENRELFDVARSGLGQCGVILGASYPVRPVKRRLRTYAFGYRDGSAFTADLLALHRVPRAELVLAGLERDEDSGGLHIVLTLGREFDDESELDDGAVAEGLHFTRALPTRDTPVWTDDGTPGHLFFRVYGETGPAAGPPQQAHPWVEHLFSLETAALVLDRFLSQPPIALRLGTVGLIPVATAGVRAPLFSLPGAEGLFVGIGLFASVPAGFKKEAAAILGDYGRRHSDAGGKRYLSGYVDFASASEWRDHFGFEAWDLFRAAKTQHDPMNLLNPGFIVWV